MKEVLTLQIGQAGTQLGNACFELFAIEARLANPTTGCCQMGNSTVAEGTSLASDKFFEENRLTNNRSRTNDYYYTPRSILIDMDPDGASKPMTPHFFESVVDDACPASSCLRNMLYQQQQANNTIYGLESAATNYAFGYHRANVMSALPSTAGGGGGGDGSSSASILDVSLNRIRKSLEGCESAEGFMLYHGIAGGTGSGFSMKLLESLSDMCGDKKLKTVWSILPDGRWMSSSPMEAYNTVLATAALRDHADAVTAFDNASVLGRISRGRGLNLSYDHTTSPIDVNIIMAQQVSNLTAEMRGLVTTTKGSASTLPDLQSYRDKISIFPRVHFAYSSLYLGAKNDVTYSSSSYSPTAASRRSKPWVDSTTPFPTAVEVAVGALEPGNSMVKCDPRYGLFMSLTILLREWASSPSPTSSTSSTQKRWTLSDVGAVHSSVATKRSIQFADWSPRSKALSVPLQAEDRPRPEFVGRARDLLGSSSRIGSVLANSTCMAEVFSSRHHHFDLLYSKRAYVHQFVQEGMEEGALCEAREEAAALEKDYEDLAAEGRDEESDGDVYY